MRVLILGAGASNPAGYPLANELLYRVGESASDSSSIQFSDAWQAWESFRKSVPASLSLIAYNSNPEVVLSLPDLYHLAAESEDEQRTTAAIRPFLKTGESSAEELEKYFDSGDRKALSTARARARPTGQADSEGSGQGKLLSPERRRRCVVRVRQQLGASERRACRVLGQPRTTQRRARKVASDEGALRGDIVRLASRFGRYGYRRVTDMLRIEGWGVMVSR